MKKYIYSILAVSSLLLVSCNEDALDKKPQSEISGDQIADIINSDPEQALRILESLESGNQRYLIQYQDTDFTGYISTKLGLDLMSNDMAQANWHWMGHFYNYLSRNANSNQTYYFWRFYYKSIYNMNEIIKYIPDASANEKLAHLKGRTQAMRAAMYLDLIRLYANGEEGIPYYSETLYDTSRVPTSTVYQKIEADLIEAYNNLATYNRPSTSKDLINKNIAAGLLARLYLTLGKYDDAVTYAKLAREGYTPMSTAQLLGGFNDVNNPEWMWGSKIDGSTNSGWASFFSHMDNTNSYGYAGGLGAGKTVDKRLYDNISSTDNRLKWFSSTTNYNYLPAYSGVKFRGTTSNFLGDVVYMRAAEMYLIEAEAYALNGNEAKAKQALYDLISFRDPNYALSTNSGQNLLNEIRIHKRIELWGEGSAFFDMKRANLPLERDYVGTNHPTWGRLNYPANSSKLKFQIPQSEINTNSTIINQNPN